MADFENNLLINWKNESNRRNGNNAKFTSCNSWNKYKNESFIVGGNILEACKKYTSKNIILNLKI